MGNDTLREFYAGLDEAYISGGKGAPETYLRARAAAARSRGERLGQEYIACMSELGGYYRGVSRYRESLAAFEEAAELIEVTCGAQSADYATNLNNMAGTYRMMGDTNAALALFRRSMEIYDALPGISVYLYAGVLNNIATLYHGKGNYADAARYLLREIELLQTDPGLVDERATAYTNLAALYRELGDSAKAGGIV